MGTLLIAVLALLGTTVSANTCTNADLCLLSCDGCTANVDKTHDPADCHNYYICDDNGSPLPLTFACSEGMHFNPYAHTCVAGDECNGCTEGINGLCVFECGISNPNDPNPIHSHAYDCGQYFDCATESYYSCSPENPYFNGDICQSDVSRCCSCQPKCTGALYGEYVIDPADCTRYCYCSSDGVATICGTCEAGNFDPVAKVCSTSSPCYTLASCYNHIGTDWCIDVYTCQAAGFFAKCLKSCVEEYYHCSASQLGKRVEPYRCALSNTVFDPISKSCVLPEQCPFTLYSGGANIPITHY